LALICFNKSRSLFDTQSKPTVINLWLKIPFGYGLRDAGMYKD
jgi:hypothetical protein